METNPILEQVFFYGYKIVVFDCLGKKEYSSKDKAKNIFCYDSNEKLLWRVHSEFDDQTSGPYTGIEIIDDKLMANRWDGGLYEINTCTGFAKPKQFLK